MGKNNGSGGNDRARMLVAQEAARIIVDQGIRDYRVAKTKAAERLGFNTRGALPGNAEVEHAIGEHHKVFGFGHHADVLRTMREAALDAMRLLSVFTPRLVGPVLNGTADANSAVNLHLFADNAEAVAMQLVDMNVPYRSYARRLKHRRDETGSYPGFEFRHASAAIQATVFPVDGIRQAPLSPIDGKPMDRADEKRVRSLVEDQY